MKNTTTSKIIFIIAMTILGITAITFLLISLFGNWTTNLPLMISLGCSGLAGILSMVYQIKNNKKATNSEE